VTTFDLSEYLAARRAAIDRALDRYIGAQPGHNHTVWRAMRYGLFPGGKRIRPILTLAAGELFGGKQEDLLPFACAVEMIHAYSLIHDDLPALDDDDLRRGAPAAHKVFGEGMALLAGDGLLTEAFCLLSAPDVRKTLAPDLLAELIHEIGCAVGVAGLVGGQAADLEAEEREVDLAAVEYVHVRKTGALIHASVRVGARVAGAKDAELRQISRYGEYLGLAFQIADDLLDHQGDAPEPRAEWGRKEPRKATYPSIVGVAQAKERLAELLQQAVKQLSSFGADAESLRVVAAQVVGRAVAEKLSSKIEESHP
jgi:geranylgeranyl diphosphate synthase type II